MPVIELARHLGEVEVGGVVAVLAHDAAARVDVPAWCRMRGQEYLGSDARGRGPPLPRTPYRLSSSVPRSGVQGPQVRLDVRAALTP